MTCGIGVTRAVPITAFDRIGVPVWTTVRPSSRHLVVNGGKGRDDAAAELSARLECLEQAVAERSPDTTELLSLGAAQARDPWAVDHVRSHLFEDSVVGPDTTSHWVPVTYLPDEAPGLAPVEAVHFPPPRGLRTLVASSSTRGLACGTSLESAILHGVFEVLERHAASLVRIGSLASTRLELGDRSRARPGGGWGRVHELCDRISAADVSPVIRVAALDRFWFAASLLTDADRPEARFDSGGYGLHTDPARAVEAALLEAIQSRATWIHGTRDDLPEKSPEAAGVLGPADDATVRGAFAGGSVVRTDDLTASLPGAASVGDHVADALAGLAALGLRAAYHAFPGDHGPFHVVRVVVPGSEDFTPQHPFVGRHLLAALRGAAGAHTAGAGATA